MVWSDVFSAKKQTAFDKGKGYSFSERDIGNFSSEVPQWNFSSQVRKDCKS